MVNIMQKKFDHVDYHSLTQVLRLCVTDFIHTELSSKVGLGRLAMTMGKNMCF